MPASATILYATNNTNHAMAWLRDHLANGEHCKRILAEFSTSWRYAMADLAGKCRRQVLLSSFGEDYQRKDRNNCCDVCNVETQLEDMSEELNIVVDAIHTVGA